MIDEFGLADSDPKQHASAHRLRAATMHRRRSWLGPLARVGRGADGSDIRELMVRNGKLDRPSPFTPAATALSWGTTAVSIGLALEDLRDGDLGILAWSILFIALSVYRTVAPSALADTEAGKTRIIVEALLPALAIVTTGGFSSPFLATIVTPVAIAGFIGGIGFALRLGLAAIAGILSGIILSDTWVTDDLELAIQWTGIVVLVAFISGWSRRISGEADRERSLALDRVERLSDANALLFSLHRVTQSLPESLDMGDVLDTTVTRLRGLCEFDAVTIMLFDETDATWEVVRSEGVALPAHIGPTELPMALKQAIADNSLIEVSEHAAGQPGLMEGARSGLYSVLPARGSLIGLLALENREPNRFTYRDVELLNGFIEPLALAIDNARWFRRLRTVGANEERTRIARDLHDRIGQSLAYVAFELDRLGKTCAKGEEVGMSVERLRGDIRDVIGEVRDTLYDLRTDVNEDNGLAETLRVFADRVEQRTGLKIELRFESDDRLPLLQEREMWRIAQEAIVNIEKHAEAAHVEVSWLCEGSDAVLMIVDDGKGFCVGEDGRNDSFGIMGMRERAASIGARFDVMSEPGAGTTVRCVLGV